MNRLPLLVSLALALPAPGQAASRSGGPGLLPPVQARLEAARTLSTTGHALLPVWDLYSPPEAQALLEAAKDPAQPLAPYALNLIHRGAQHRWGFADRFQDWRSAPELSVPARMARAFEQTLAAALPAEPLELSRLEVRHKEEGGEVMFQRFHTDGSATKPSLYLRVLASLVGPGTLLDLGREVRQAGPDEALVLTAASREASLKGSVPATSHAGPRTLEERLLLVFDFGLRQPIE